MQQPITGTFEKYFTRQEERAIFSACRRHKGDPIARRDFWIMTLMRRTGGRVGSIAGINVGDALDALAGEELFFRTAKGDRAYSVPVFKTARVALRALLKLRQLAGHQNDDRDAPLLMSRHKRRICVRSLQLRVAHWCAEAKVPNGSPHYFRHTLGRRIMVDSIAKEPLLIVQRVLGHTSLKNTAIYARPGREEVRQALEGQA